MRIKITYSSILKIDDIDSGDSVEIDEGTSVSELLTKCNIIESHQTFLQIYVNGRHERLQYIIQNKDIIDLILPLGGG